MKKILFLILKIQIYQSLKLKDQKLEILIPPNIKTSITPFLLDPENLHDTTTAYTLDITCSENISRVIKHDVHTKILCGGEPLKFGYDALKIYLNKLEVSLKEDDFSETSEIFIDYNLWYEDLDGRLIKQDVRQEMKVINKIPVLVNNYEFEYNYELDNRKVFVNVLEVDHKYFYNHHIGFGFRVTDGKFPKWLIQSLERNKLILHGDIPDDLEEDFMFNYEIFDEKTKLHSDNYSFEIFAFNKEKKGKKSHVHIWIAIICVFAVIIVGGAIFYFLFKKKKNDDVDEIDKNKDEVIKDSYKNWEKEKLQKRDNNERKNFDFEDLKVKEMKTNQNLDMGIKFSDNFGKNKNFKTKNFTSFSDIEEAKDKDASDFLNKNPFDK